MTIYRDGKEIVLTTEECNKIYYAVEKEYQTEDLKSQLEQMDVELDITDELIERFNDALGRNDGYWESYWLTAEYVIEDYMQERACKHE